eukprot:114967_1
MTTKHSTFRVDPNKLLLLISGYVHRKLKLFYHIPYEILSLIKKFYPKFIDEYDYLYRLIIIGDSGTGKTNILLRFVENTFTDSFISTIGIDFKIKTIEYKCELIKLQIWEATGGERFQAISHAYYKSADGMIIVYDITDRASYNHMSVFYLDKINQFAKENMPILIIGNKIDLEYDRNISYDEAKLFCDNHKLEFIETSAKMSENINKAFVKMTKMIKSTNETNYKSYFWYQKHHIKQSKGNRNEKNNQKSCVLL